MKDFKDLRIVDNFYQTSSFFPMPTTLIGTMDEEGETSFGAYSLVFPYYVGSKGYYAMILECRNSSNTCKGLLRHGKCTINFMPDDKKTFKGTLNFAYVSELRATIPTYIISKINNNGGIIMVDMHMHTLYSDGDKTVEEVLKMCEEKKLEYISITDHNTCKQYEDEALNKNIFTGKIIKGAEMNATFNNKKIEFKRSSKRE